MTTPAPGPVTVTTLGPLIEGFHGRLIPLASIPAIFKDLNAVCVMAIKDDKLRGGGRKYSAHARDSYPTPERPFTAKDEGYLFLWWDAFWNWREMLTPDDFYKLNGETVMVSEVTP